MRAATVLLLVVASAAVGRSPADVTFAPTGGGFEARFPGQPKASTQKMTDGSGLTVYAATFTTIGGGVYLTSFTEYPAAFKAEARDGLLVAIAEGFAGKGGKVEQATKGEFGPAKHACRDVVIAKPDGKQVRLKLIVKDARMYQVGVLGDRDFVTSKPATDFLDSFKLVP